MINLTRQALEEFVHFMYRHFDAFKLVVCCSAGTVWEHYIIFEAMAPDMPQERALEFIRTLTGSTVPVGTPF